MYVYNVVNVGVEKAFISRRIHTAKAWRQYSKRVGEQSRATLMLSIYVPTKHSAIETIVYGDNKKTHK